MQKYLVIDYETFSECPLDEAGAWEYSLHPSTEILCIAFKIGTRETLPKAKTQVIYKEEWKNTAVSSMFMSALLSCEYQIVAHNALFEMAITKNVLSKITNLLGSHLARDITINRWVCTAALARAHGLPGALEHAAKALKLKNKKDEDGHSLMLKLSKPKKPSKADPSTRHTNPSDYVKLGSYCITDVDVESELFCSLPDLIPRERLFWKLDQKINLRGFKVDRELAKGAIYCATKEIAKHDKRVVKITKGKLQSTRQVQAVKKYIKKLGCKIPNMQQQTIQEYLAKDDVHPKAKQLLEIRGMTSKSSVAKYQAFEIRSRSDGRARDNTIYYGAHTGRQAGTGLQPQNLFKTVIPQADVECGLKLIRAKDLTAIRALYKPIELLASAIRSSIVAPEGYILDVCDFAAIEVRVLFWLADHEEGLQAYREGKDLYIAQAADIYDTTETELKALYVNREPKAVKKRELGKQTVLGAGFGMGLDGRTFVATCKKYNIEVSEALAKRAIISYRSMHKPIPKFWGAIEKAACSAVLNPTKSFVLNGKMTWKMETFQGRKWLTCQMPSGGKLYYYKPELRRKQTFYGETYELSYMSWLTKYKKYVRIGTWGGKLAENVTQRGARDLLYDAMLRMEQKKLRVVLAVHDELVVERDEWTKRATFDLMAKNPDWAEGLPIKVEGWSDYRYRK